MAATVARTVVCGGRLTAGSARWQRAARSDSPTPASNHAPVHQRPVDVHNGYFLVSAPVQRAAPAPFRHFPSTTGLFGSGAGVVGVGADRPVSVPRTAKQWADRPAARGAGNPGRPQQETSLGEPGGRLVGGGMGGRRLQSPTRRDERTEGLTSSPFAPVGPTSSGPPRSPPVECAAARRVGSFRNAADEGRPGASGGRSLRLPPRNTGAAAVRTQPLTAGATYSDAPPPGTPSHGKSERVKGGGRPPPPSPTQTLRRVDRVFVGTGCG